MRVDTVDVVAAVEHREYVSDLVAEIGCDGFWLLQHRHLRSQSRVAHQRADIERRWDDHPVDVAPLTGRLGFWLPIAVLYRFPAPLSGPPDAEVDAAGVERVEHSEALDDCNRCRLPQLHRCRADTNPVGGGGDLTDQHRGRRAGDRDEVMFGDPVALVSPLFGVLGEVDRIAQRRCGVAAFADRRQVEDRQRNAHDGSTLA